MFCSKILIWRRSCCVSLSAQRCSLIGKANKMFFLKRSGIRLLLPKPTSPISLKMIPSFFKRGSVSLSSFVALSYLSGDYRGTFAPHAVGLRKSKPCPLELHEWSLTARRLQLRMQPQISCSFQYWNLQERHSFASESVSGIK